MPPRPEPTEAAPSPGAARRLEPVATLWLRRSDRAAAAALVVLALAFLAYRYAARGGPGATFELRRGEPPPPVAPAEIAPDEAVTPENPTGFLVDLNTAETFELTELPGVGPTIAERILASRAADGPFRRAEDLLRVKGIGDKTLAKLRPYLAPLPDDPPAGGEGPAAPD